jgi:diaminohydroxyphosphoribosylaminopyrimidine deaminase/5-amino-6-(5-phosphoribosylamino)uracil reductase
MKSHDDEAWMLLALAAARRGSGRTHPNPSVGAVVWKGKRLLGRGTTRPPGGAHAEVVALAAAERRHGRAALRGASLAVTLEPCCFRGRTGPCTEAIIDAGIARVLIGCRDPHHRVSGRGMARLRRAGLKVQRGVLEVECHEHHRGFFSVCERGRPFVTLKLASTLDGRIATASGESRWITGPEARRMVHRLRARVDAVMVGSGTALADDPELTARSGDRVVARPDRVLVDSRLRVPAAARLYADSSQSETFVLTRPGARGRRAIAATGARLIDLPGPAGAIDLRAGLEALAENGLTSLLVEGGGELAAALLRAELVDEIHWLLAPILIGADGRPALGSLGVQRLAQAAGLAVERTRRLGADLHIRARLAEPQGGGRQRRRQHAREAAK